MSFATGIQVVGVYPLAAIPECWSHLPSLLSGAPPTCTSFPTDSDVNKCGVKETTGEYQIVMACLLLSILVLFSGYLHIILHTGMQMHIFMIMFLAIF